jgi:hypothetical protein
MTFMTNHLPTSTHDAVLGLDPRTTQDACRTGNGPRIESEGGAVYAEDSR